MLGTKCSADVVTTARKGLHGTRHKADLWRGRPNYDRGTPRQGKWGAERGKSARSVLQGLAGEETLAKAANRVLPATGLGRASLTSTYLPTIQESYLTWQTRLNFR